MFTFIDLIKIISSYVNIIRYVNRKLQGIIIETALVFASFVIDSRHQERNL